MQIDCSASEGYYVVFTLIDVIFVIKPVELDVTNRKENTGYAITAPNCCYYTISASNIAEWSKTYDCLHWDCSKKLWLIV